MDATPSNLALVITAVAAAIPPTLAALAAFVSSVRNQRKLEVVKERLDGRLEELLAVTRAAYFARGVKAELEGPTGQTLSPHSGSETLGNSAGETKSPDNGAN